MYPRVPVPLLSALEKQIFPMPSPFSTFAGARDVAGVDGKKANADSSDMSNEKCPVMEGV